MLTLILMLIRIITAIAIRSTLPLIIEHLVEAEAEAVYLPAPATDVRRALREEELHIPREVEASEVVKNYYRVCPLIVVVVIIMGMVMCIGTAKKTEHAAKAEAHHTEESESEPCRFLVRALTVQVQVIILAVHEVIVEAQESITGAASAAAAINSSRLPK